MSSNHSVWRRLLSLAGVIGVFIIGLVIGLATSGKSGTAASPAATVTVTANPVSPAIAPRVTATATVTASAPAPRAGSVLVSRTSANETWNSKPFNIGSGPVSVKYSFSNCPDGSGNFIADLITSGVSQSSQNYEDINVANIIGAGGGTTSQEYPQQPGSRYYLAIQTECSYSVTVKGG